MESKDIVNQPIQNVEEKIREDLDLDLSLQKRRKFSRFTLAALSSIPWIGGFLSATASFEAEKDQDKVNDMHRQWLEEHSLKIQKLAQALIEIMQRLEQLGEETEERIENEEYLNLTRKGFRIWDKADTEEKRTLIKKLLTNAGAKKLCSDDLIRLFLDWIEKYHESHFAVIREIYNNQGITRGQIWDRIHGSRPRDDSSEADLFRLLIGDLSTGRVIRQYRETNAYGQFVQKKKTKSSGGVMKSAFDDIEPYELTELGRQFVHYAMEDVVPRIN